MLASHQPLNKVQQIVVTDAHAGQRIDNFLTTYLRGVPKSRIYRIIRKGEVRVNKGRISVSYRLVCGDTVRIPPVRMAEERAISSHPSNKLTKALESAICYEDQELLIINKPAGLAVHGGSGISLGLIEALRAMRPEASFLELAHRLDRDTSGCVMIAKSRKMLIYLHDCLKSGKIQKRYYALVPGKWQGGKKVEAPLLKYVLQSGERLVKVDVQGKPSKTTYEIVESFPNATLLEASPVTGRTHQIRVHCAFMGSPILGDQKYGDQDAKTQAKIVGYDRLFLHAYKLVIQLPNGSDSLTVESQLPKAFEEYCQELRT